MARRWKRYKFAASISGGAAAANSPLDRYAQYKAGKIKPEYVRDPESLPKGEVLKYILPFGKDLSTGQQYQVTMSQRVQDKLSTLVGNTSVFNHAAGTVAPENILVNLSFEPARAIIRQKGGNKTDEFSKITGQKYKKSATNDSYVVPFGRTGTVRQTDQASTITAALTQADNIKASASFTPERFRRI
ncbi:MAG: hypothetical protein AAGF26_02695 [Cyanobacteria bacterium P01_G01_bin.49]